MNAQEALESSEGVFSAIELELRDILCQTNNCENSPNCPEGTDGCAVMDIAKIINREKVEAVEGMVKVVNELKNPYPESIFSEPTKEEYKMFHEYLVSKGLTLDKFSGSIGRIIWVSLKKNIELKLAELKGEGK